MDDDLRPEADVTLGAYHRLELPADIADALRSMKREQSRSLPRILFVPSARSTNDLAARFAAANAADFTTVVAEQQTAGRGRLGRTWFSPPGAGLYASTILVAHEVIGSLPFIAPMVTLAAGVSLAEAVRACTHLPVEIKWPNDLVIGRRKLAGILTEASSDGTSAFVVVGFGINLRSAAYPPEIGDRATSIEAELGRTVDRGQLLVECLASIRQWVETLRAGRAEAVLERWRALAPSSRGSRVEWAAPVGPEQGITDGIDADGALRVRVGDRVERVIAGEITWL